jgi:pyridoxal phosphate enzyme (YggS family)
METDKLRKNLEVVRERMTRAVAKSGRKSGDVRLLAVSKTKPIEMIQAALQMGQHDFGENYAQELRDKAAGIQDSRIRWHFIGSLQRNKVKYLAGKVAMIHSIDSSSLIEEIDKRAKSLDVKVPILLEVKLSEEESKAGINPAGLVLLGEFALDHHRVELKGLMTMPPYFPDPEQSRPYYIRLRKIKEDLEKRLNQSLPELSMGMSGDFEVAIEEGATIVRVGTAIFGEREQCKVSMASSA